MMKQAVIILVLLGSIYCQNLNSLDFDVDLKDLKNIDLQDLEANATHLPGVQDVEKVLRDKCAKKGAPDAVDLMKEEQINAKLCVEAYVNVTAVQEQLEEAKKTGSMDEVFAKYCKLWPEIYSCFDNATLLARKCMDEREEKSFNKSLEILKELKEFSCFKDGDRLAMFVAEGGIECIGERREGVQECFNKTLGGRLPNSDDLSASSLPVFLFSDEDCEDFDEIRHCINTELEKCSESTPANIVDAFLKFVKKQMPCEVVKPSEKLQASSKDIHSSSSATVLFITSLIVRFY
nr:27 kDa hemolymph glycoprotein-like [Leptinotarsa decemlineata]